jgi:hypothetical protein
VAHNSTREYLTLLADRIRFSDCFVGIPSVAIEGLTDVRPKVREMQPSSVDGSPSFIAPPTYIVPTRAENLRAVRRKQVW